MTRGGTDGFQLGDASQQGADQLDNGWIIQPVFRVDFYSVKGVLEDRNQG